MIPVLGVMHSGAILLLLLVPLCHLANGQINGTIWLGDLIYGHHYFCDYPGYVLDCDFTDADEDILISKMEDAPFRDIRIRHAKNVDLSLPLCDLHLTFYQVSSIHIISIEENDLRFQYCNNTITATHSGIENFTNYQVSSMVLTDTKVLTLNSVNSMDEFEATRSTFGHIQNFFTSNTEQTSRFSNCSIGRISSMVVENNLIFVNTRIDVINDRAISLMSDKSIKFINVTIGMMGSQFLQALSSNIRLENVIVENANRSALSAIRASFVTMTNVTILNCNGCFISDLMRNSYQLSNVTVENLIMVVQNRTMRLLALDKEPKDVFETEGSTRSITLGKDETKGCEISTYVDSCEFESFALKKEKVKNVKINVHSNVTIDSTIANSITAIRPMILNMVNSTIGSLLNVVMVDKCYIGEDSSVLNMINITAENLMINSSFIDEIYDLTVNGNVVFVDSEIGKLLSINVTANSNLSMENTSIHYEDFKSIYLAKNATFSMRNIPANQHINKPFISALSYDQIDIDDYRVRGAWFPLFVRLRLQPTTYSDAPFHRRDFDTEHHCSQYSASSNNKEARIGCYIPNYGKSVRAIMIKDQPWVKLASGGYGDNVVVENVGEILLEENFRTHQLSLMNTSIQEFVASTDSLSMRDVLCDILQPKIQLVSLRTTNSTILQLDVVVMHANVASSRIAHVIKMGIGKEFIVTHSHIERVLKNGVLVEPRRTLIIKDTVIEVMESEGIIVEGTLIMKNVVITNLNEMAIITGLSGERNISLENVIIEKGNLANFSLWYKNFTFINVTLNGKRVHDWTPELRKDISEHISRGLVDDRPQFENEGILPPNSTNKKQRFHPKLPQNNVTNVSQTTTEYLTETATENVPETATENVTEIVPQTVTEAVPQTVTEAVPQTVTEAVPQTVTKAVPQTVTKADPQTETEAVPETIMETVTEAVLESIPETATENATESSSAIHLSAEKSGRPIVTSHSVWLTVVGVIMAGAFVVLILFVAKRHRYLRRSSALATHDSAPDHLISSAEQAVFGALPSSAATCLMDVDLTAHDDMYSAGGRGLIDPTEVTQGGGWPRTPYGRLVEDQQIPNGSGPSGSERSTSNNPIHQMTIMEDPEEYEAALMNDKKSSVSVWSRMGIVKYSRFR